MPLPPPSLLAPQSHAVALVQHPATDMLTARPSPPGYLLRWFRSCSNMLAPRLAPPHLKSNAAGMMALAYQVRSGGPVLGIGWAAVWLGGTADVPLVCCGWRGVSRRRCTDRSASHFLLCFHISSLPTDGPLCGSGLRHPARLPAVRQDWGGVRRAANARQCHASAAGGTVRAIQPVLPASLHNPDDPDEWYPFERFCEQRDHSLQ